MNTGSALQQHTHHNVEIVGAGRDHSQMERCIPQRVDHIRIGSVLQKLLDNGYVATAGGQMQGTAIVLVGGIRIGPTLQDAVEQLDVAGGGGCAQFAAIRLDDYVAVAVGVLQPLHPWAHLEALAARGQSARMDQAGQILGIGGIGIQRQGRQMRQGEVLAPVSAQLE